MIGLNELKNELEKINRERSEIKKERGERRMLPLVWDKHIRKAIGYLFRYGRVKINDLAENLKIHIKDIEYVIGILEKNGLIRKESDNNVIITEEGDRIAKELGFRVQFQNQKDRFLPPYLLKDIEEAVSNFTKSIFPPNPYLFQWYFATGSIQDITEYMIKEFDVEGRNVACVMSSTVGLSLSLTGYTANGGKGVYVFDKDKDIIKELRRRGVQSIEYDVADPIPQDRVKSFNYLTKTGSK